MPSNEKLSEHPPIVSISDPDFSAASAETKAEWQKLWNAWQNGGEQEIIRAIVVEAIEQGLIPAID